MNSKTRVCPLALLGLLPIAQAAHAHPAAHHRAAPHKAHASPAPPEADWFADPALTQQLGPEMPFGAYTLRLPPGMALAGSHRELYTLHNDDVSAFQGEKRPDGSRLSMLVVVVSVRPGATFNTAAPEVLQRLDDKFFAHATHPVKSPTVYGRISGLETLRQYFKMDDKDGKTHGFQYWMIGTTSAIAIIAADTEPHNAESLPLAEATALSLNKQ